MQSYDFYFIYVCLRLKNLIYSAYLQLVHLSQVHQLSKRCISALLVHFQGVQQSLLHQQSKRCYLFCWCT